MVNKDVLPIVVSFRCFIFTQRKHCFYSLPHENSLYDSAASVSEGHSFTTNSATGSCCNWSEETLPLPVIGRHPANVYVALVALRRLRALFLGSGYMMVLKMQLMLGSFLFLNVCCSLVSALYFHIGETEKKCFIEEIPDETMIIGQYVKWKFSGSERRLAKC